MERQFSTKHFIHHVDQFGKRLFTVTYDLKIPLPSQNCAPADLFGHLLAQNDLPPPFLMEVRAKFEKFVRDETRKFDAELAARRIENALAMSADENMGDAFVALATNCNVDDVVANCDANHHGMPLASPGNTYKAEPLFEEQFQHVMRNASMNKLSLLLAEESRMTEELRALVRARNFEVERIKRICEQTIVQSVADATVNEFDKHSYEISMHNEKLRQVSSNYSHQIEALNERQRQEFRQLVHEMYANEKSLSSGGKKEFASLSSSFSCANALSASAQIPQPPHYSRPFQKSLSYDSKIMAQQQQQSEIGTICRQPVPISQCCSESFTIYIGAQLKTMHNARILTCDQLVDLLSMDNNENDNKSICGNFGTNDKTIIPHVDDDNVIICHSQRLQLLMNLYRRDLACAVLIVDASDPLWHVKERSKFAQLCEHSAELHFDSLERQLLKIEQDLMKANRERRSAAALRRRRQQRDCDDGKAATDEPSLPGSGATSSSLPRLIPAYNVTADDISELVQVDDQHTMKELIDDYCGDVNSLYPGDVYLTCHSNLSAVQVAFHVVGDRQLVEQDITSRHPCINALRNVIRLAPHSGIHHITFPLLLVEHMSETMTISWCMSRAELVFKCLKGFLMEVCSSGVSTAIAGGGGAVVGTSGNAGGTPHFNINFVLPSAISAALFQQLVELFSSIFHSVPSLNATNNNNEML